MLTSSDRSGGCVGFIESTISLATLESKLTTYISQKESSQAPFEMSNIPRISREQACQEALRADISYIPFFFVNQSVLLLTDWDELSILGARQEASSDLAGFNSTGKATDQQSARPAVLASTTAETQRECATQLSAVPEFSTYGKLLKSSAKPIPLTEHETEYVVSVVKHIFAEHVVFQVSLRLPIIFREMNISERR